MSNLIPYNPYDEEAAKEEEADLNKTEFFKAKPGKNIVRFLPPPQGRRSPFLRVQQHYVNMPGQERPLVFACPRYRQTPKPCPVCQQAEKYHRSGKKADQRRASDLWPSRRIFANVIDRDNEDTGPMVFAFGKTIHEQLIEIRKEDGDFTNPYQGFDIKIRRKGTGKNDTEYRCVAGMVSPLHDDEKQALAWFEAQHDLTKFARVMEPDEILAAIRGDDDDDDDDDDRRPPGVIDVGADSGPDDDIPF